MSLKEEDDYKKRHYKLLSSFQKISTPQVFKNKQTLKLHLFENDVNEQQEGSLMSLLHYACQFGDKEEVEQLLAAGADIFMKDSNGNLPLHYLVAATDDVETFRLIYEKAADDEEKKKLITAKNSDGFSPFWYAVESKHNGIAEHWKKEMINLKFNYRDELTELKKKYGTKLGIKDSWYEYDSLLILRAAKINDTELLKKLLPIENYRNDITNTSGYDPLRIAISYDNVESVKLLLPYSIIDDYFLYNIFYVAIKHHSTKVIKYLLFNADTELTKLNFRYESDFKEGTVVNLCRTKLLFEQNDATLRTSLHDVAKTGNINIYLVINEFYEDINIRDINLQTPLHIAAENKNNEIFCLIFKRSTFALHLKDKNGETPFSIICRNNLTYSLEYVNKNSKLFSEEEKRKYFLNLAMETRCIWLINLIFVWPTGWVVFDKIFLETNEKNKEIKFKKLLYSIYHDDQAFLKQAIKEGFAEAIHFLLKLPNWEIIFRRQYPSERNSNTRSPIQLLITHEPEMAKILFDQCYTEDKKFVYYGLINDDFYQYNDETFQEFIEYKSLNAEEKTDANAFCATFSNVDEREKLLKPDRNESNKIDGKRPSRYKVEKEYVQDEKAGYRELPFFQTVLTHPLTLMIKHQRYSLLSHPLVVSYIEYKWNKFAKWGYYSLCFYYLLIALSLTVLTITGKPSNSMLINKDDMNATTFHENIKLNNSSTKNFVVFLQNLELNNATPTATEIFSNGSNNIISGSIITVIWIIQFGLLITRYFLYHTSDLKNRWFDLITLVLTLFASLPICLLTNSQTHWNIIVVLNFCSSITLLNYLKKHPRFGVYVVMITYVFTSFLRFSPIFFMVLLPFVVLFYVLLGDGTGLFSFFDTFIHTLVMMIGEFDYKDSVSSKDSFVTSAMFCLFLFAVTIFLMNLLTGLAVSDTTKIMQEAILTRRIMQIETIHHIEIIMPNWIRRRYWHGCCKNPKVRIEMKKEIHRFSTPQFRKLFKWWGMSKAAARLIDSGNVVEDKLDALEQKMDQKISIMNDKITLLDKKMDDIVVLLHKLKRP